MTATERLRALLDERGVEWACVDLTTGEERDNLTEWNIVDGGWVEAREISGHISYTWYMGEKFSPEQAVDATLGRGTCKYEYRADDDRMHCSECGQRLVFKLDFMHYCPNCGAKVVE